MFLAFEADILRSGVRRLEKLANILPNNNHLLSTPAPRGSSIFDMFFLHFLNVKLKNSVEFNVKCTKFLIFKNNFNDSGIWIFL